MYTCLQEQGWGGTEQGWGGTGRLGWNWKGWGGTGSKIKRYQFLKFDHTKLLKGTVLNRTCNGELCLQPL